MRFVGNFNPEWGYLAPAPSFIRTVRIAVVAAAVGATAGAAVVFSLVDRPTAEESVAARTLARPLDSAASRTASLQVSGPAVQGQAKPDAAAQGQSVLLSPANAAAVSPAASETGASSTIQLPASIAALAEPPAVTDIPAPSAPSLQKKRVKRHHSAPRREEANGDVKGPLALLRSFSARATTGSSWPYE